MLVVLSSPVLNGFHVLIQVNCDQVCDADISRQLHQSESARRETTLRYFEYTTPAALMLFEQQKVDVAVLEVGLGGRLDAVNLVDTDCAIITSVDIDHTDYRSEESVVGQGGVGTCG